jgi:CRISPR-associated endonuclease/helicase Cas3
MSELRLDDFDAYFTAVHGVPPFPWQGRLLRQVVQHGWPPVLDLPTGSGKTAVLDVALFHLALDTTSEPRRAPIRIVLVVDRRTVVDQAFDRATKIGAAIEKASTATLRAISERLSALSGGKPLHVALLRGGIVRDDEWARSPVQPVIALSTVDQVGSRLLFRGYGVSHSMRPIHAGLLGNDTLFVLDEVHLAEPFRQTLTAIQDRYRRWAERPLPDRWRVTSMSATASHRESAPFQLDEADRSHPVLRRRLEARKPVRLVEVRVTGDSAARMARFADHLAEAAAPPADIPGAAIAVVVNRVRTAHLVFERIRKTHGETAVVHLLTGRMRPLDREGIEAEIKQRSGAGRRPRVPEDGKPTIVVSTQCIEAGADLDFDVLITECASFDALKQRFGRLNRLGDVARCLGAVLVRADQLDARDPIYGDALAATWTFLGSRAKPGPQPTVDFGIGSADIRIEDAGDFVAPLADAPVLLPAYLDTWVQTSPVPDPDPDISLWLHGPGRSEPEVQIVWRADIDQPRLEGAAASDDALEHLREQVEVCPPTTIEALSVPLSAARRWLANAGSDDVGDVEGLKTSDDEDLLLGRPALAWRGEDSVVVSGRGIEPGDTLVVPSAYGGLRNRNWAPDSGGPVSDIGDRAASRSGRYRVLRLHEAVWRWTLEGLGATPVGIPSPPQPTEDPDGEMPTDDALDAWLSETAPLLPQGWLSEIMSSFTIPRNRRVLRLTGDGQPGVDGSVYYAVVARRRGQTTTEDEVSSFTGAAVSLWDHLAGVGALARDFAGRCGLPPETMGAVELAGRRHDIGKADPRFQLLLHGGNTFKAAVAPELLAKSGLSPLDRAARTRARLRSGYPRGCRHELMSAALLLSSPAALPPTSELDLDLVLHLVSSHHGWGRPLAPIVFDEDPREIAWESGDTRLRMRSDHGLERLDSGVSDRFFRLVRRYGWFGLAWLEAILRLADHRQSEREQTETEGKTHE